METNEHDAMKQPERETTGGQKMEKNKDKANKLEEKLKEHFPNVRYNDWPEFECIVVPMSRSDLISGKLKTLVQSVKEYEEGIGYKFAGIQQSEDAIHLTYDLDNSRHNIDIDGMFPNQVNIYYKTENRG